MQELINIVPDDATLHLLIGNLYLQDGNEQQASQHYRRSAELHDYAGAHVNLGNLHFFNNDFATAVTEYNKAEALDPKLAIAFYDDSVALGELYKFDEQAQKLDQAKQHRSRRRSNASRRNPPAQKVVSLPPADRAGVERVVEHRPPRRGAVALRKLRVVRSDRERAQSARRSARS